MMVLDIFTLTILFLLALVVVAIVLMHVYRRGYCDGEAFGAAAERANKWESVARAQSQAAAMSLGIRDKDVEDWLEEIDAE